MCICVCTCSVLRFACIFCRFWVFFMFFCCSLSPDWLASIHHCCVCHPCVQQITYCVWTVKCHFFQVSWLLLLHKLPLPVIIYKLTILFIHLLLIWDWHWIITLNSKHNHSPVEGMSTGSGTCVSASCDRVSIICLFPCLVCSEENSDTHGAGVPVHCCRWVLKNHRWV